MEKHHGHRNSYNGKYLIGTAYNFIGLAGIHGAREAIEGSTS